MKEKKLRLNNGNNIPAIGFGTWQLREGEEVRKAVAEAIETGYHLIDTARLYNNESGVGEAIRSSGIAREKIFITTKLWNSDQSYDDALRAFESSLARLKLDYLDLYLIHWPTDKRSEAWQALQEIYKNEKARSIGVSNYDVTELEELLAESRIIPAVNQIEFHPFVYNQQRPILDFCKQHEIIVEAYSPLAQARQLNHPVINKIAAGVGRTNAQVMLRWAIQHGTIPIPKSSNPARIKENYKVFDFDLAEEDMAALNNLSR